MNPVPRSSRETEPVPTRLSPLEFAEAFTSCSRALWCIAAGILGCRDQVDDVLQEGAVIALGKLDQFEPGTSFIAWMGRIVRYVALNHSRRRHRAPARALDPVTIETVVAAAPPRPEAPASARGVVHAEQEAFDDEVLRALHRLDETARACLLLRTVLDLPYRDIARSLDISEGTAMSHVHRARHRLRSILSGEGGSEEAPAAPRGGVHG